MKMSKFCLVFISFIKNVLKIGWPERSNVHSVSTNFDWFGKVGFVVLNEIILEIAINKFTKLKLNTIFSSFHFLFTFQIMVWILISIQIYIL